MKKTFEEEKTPHIQHTIIGNKMNSSSLLYIQKSPRYQAGNISPSPFNLIMPIPSKTLSILAIYKAVYIKDGTRKKEKIWLDFIIEV